MRRLTLRFDGSCWPNPGGVCAYGWVLLDTDGFLSSGRGRVEGLARQARTNNVAEWHALLAGLRALADMGLEDVESLTIEGDSQLVVNCLCGEWKTKKMHLAKLRDACRESLGLLGCEWKVRWIPREQNQEADALSR